MSRGRWFGIAVLALLAAATAGARPVAIGGVVQGAAVSTRVLAGGETLAVWTLPRLGVAVRNDARDLRLLYGERELRFSPERGWRAVGFTLPLDVRLGVPQLAGGSLYVPLTAVRALGVRVIADAPDVLDFAAPPAVPVATLPPSPDAPQPQVIQPTQPQAAQPLPTAPTASVPATPARPAATPTPPEPVEPRPPVNPVPPVPVTPPASVPSTPVIPPTTPPTPPPPVVSPPPVPTPTPPPAPLASVANLDTVRISRTLHRTVEVQRVVLELSGEAPHQITRENGGLSVLLPGVTSSGSSQRLESGDTLSVEPGVVGVSPRRAQTTVRLRTGGGRSEVFTLEDPPRVVIDTTTYTDTRVPPPIDPEGLPGGVTYRARGILHLLSFDPARFQPRVVTAPAGAARDVASLVKGVGGVAGVNGGYFDPASSLPVDLVAVGGLMTAPSLERRATVGFTAQGGTFFGYPRPRYVLSGAFGSVTVNSVGAKVRPELLTAFVGDGRTSVGAAGLTSLYLTPGTPTVTRVVAGRNVPPAGALALTFDPARFPQLPRGVGEALTTTLNWQATDAPWPTAQDALSAGPLLVRGGQVVLNAAREQFDTRAGVWRPTRQVAFGVMAGQPTIAYLEHGSPEAFASALAGAGVRDAVRLDSGSSATAFLTGGYGDLGGYLNTVWSRPVPNAIVFVPKANTARR
ncbi:phosphodiester glycosidase family protein [Deinococcus sp. YIM 134068]|uniref:phosphodiester glycosidase family protein n=1 Tax=Deinococcus lichenicola TaxID=3118910 RepID=UPI002F93EF81